MNTLNRELELVSFSLCPYVQRSVITLKHKNVPFKLTFIDLENPPSWFDDISPMGKVPVLIVTQAGAKTVIFESAVINEYIDETTGEPMHPKDPLRKAMERAWIEYGSELFGSLYPMTLETDAKALEGALAEFFSDLKKLECVVSAEGPFFRGKDLSLVDAAYAPLFMRVFLSKRVSNDSRWSSMTRVRKWGEALMHVPAVRESVAATFDSEYAEFCRSRGSLLY